VAVQLTVTDASNTPKYYNLPKLKVQDIDTIEDFKFAEYLYRHINK
jgi:CMP-N-acetylneuraminic acid synthetase